MRRLSQPLVRARLGLGRFRLTWMLNALLGWALSVGLIDTAALAQPPALPPGISANAVMQDAWLDGQRAAIWSLRSADPVDQLAQAIERHWRAAEPSSVFRGEDSGWVTISRILSGAMETAQIRAGGPGAVGYFTRWHAQPPRGPGTGALISVLPADLTLLRQILVTEAGQHVSTLIAQSSREARALLPDLTRSLSRLGMARRAVPGQSGPDTTVSTQPVGASLVRFESDARELMLTLDRRGSITVLVFHLVEAIR